MKILLTGKPGIGKTTVVKKVYAFLGEKASGFWTEEIRDKTGKRIGFKIITTEKKECILASKYIDTHYRVSSYSVDINCIEKTAVPVLEKAILEDKIVLIDEIGKMELFSLRFLNIVKDIFEKKHSILATVPIKNIHPFVKELKNRKDILLIEVTYSNRDNLPEKIIHLLNR